MVEYEIKKAIDVSKGRFKEIDETNNNQSKLLKLTLFENGNYSTAIDKDSAFKKTKIKNLTNKKIKILNDQLTSYNKIMFLTNKNFSITSSLELNSKADDVPAKKENSLDEFEEFGLFYRNKYQDTIINSTAPPFTNIVINQFETKDTSINKNNTKIPNNINGFRDTTSNINPQMTSFNRNQQQNKGVTNNSYNRARLDTKMQNLRLRKP